MASGLHVELHLAGDPECAIKALRRLLRNCGVRCLGLRPVQPPAIASAVESK